MLLAVDIGNTMISLAVLRGKRIVGRFSVETPCKGQKNSWAIIPMLKDIKEKHPQINKGVVCSVVPPVSKMIQSVVKRRFNIKLSVIGEDIKVPIQNNYRDPQQVGQDRLVGAYAAKCLYGVPAIIIDFGTAITFDVVSSKGIYEGGIIIPGIRLSVESLFQKTALLPPVNSIKIPRQLIGKDTEESILSGIFWGYGTMASGLIDLIQKKCKGRAKVIVTGGHTSLMKKFIVGKIDEVDKDLVFKGMKILKKNS